MMLADDSRGVELARQPDALYELIAALWCKLTRHRRHQFALLLCLMVLGSVAEVISVGAMLPFLGILTTPERVFAHAGMQPIVQFFGIETPQQLLLPIVIIFCAAVLLAGAIRIWLLLVSTRFSFAVGADLSIDAYRRTLFQPYAVHIARNSSEVINGIVGKTAMLIGSILVPLLTLFSSVILLVGILAALIAVAPAIALAVGAVFVSVYWLLLQVSRRSLEKNSQCIAYESTQVLKSLQEGLGGIRDVLIDGTQEAYCNIYLNADRPLRSAQASNTFISASPRYVIETLGVMLMAGTAYTISQTGDGIVAAIPVLGALALGAQRLLPVLQQTYSSLSIIKGAEASLRDAFALLDQPLPPHLDKPLSGRLSFDSEIAFQNVGFRYSAETPWVFRGVNLTLRKGQKVGFIGQTGSGKSTLLDIVMALLSPTEGRMLIDEETVGPHNCRSWQKHIAHVPQSIYLTDGTVEENIAFGIPGAEIDFLGVREAARKAHISELIESWPEQYKSRVGERGVRLSGGQRQRIGIARAMYKKASVLIFDEATSALDNDTERVVMEAIDGLGDNITVLIIAHRMSTLKNCDLIVELGKDGALRLGQYADFLTAH